MDTHYIEDKTFDKKDFSVTALQKGTYENCQFINCNFSNATLSYLSFTDCQFTGCNLSMAKTTKTAFTDVLFKDCKLLGVHFDDCNDFLFTVSFENCMLNLSSFYKRKLQKTIFKNCSLHEVDFTDADLSGTIFNHCDLLQAIFDNTVLEKADFRTAFNYALDPAKNRVKKARFSMAGIKGLLHQFNIEIS